MKTIEFDRDIEACAAAWGASGAVAVCKDGQFCFAQYYGTEIEEKSTYCLPYRNRFLMGLCIGKLLDEGTLDLSYTLDRWIPEYTHAAEITLGQLCLKQSGVPDFLNGQMMKELQKEPYYQKMDAKHQNLEERRLAVYPWSLEEVLARINGKNLNVVPGTEPTDDLVNLSETVLIEEVIRRASGQTLEEYIDREIFAPLAVCAKKGKADTISYAAWRGGEFMSSSPKDPENGLFLLDAEGAKGLLEAVVSRKLLSEAAWEVISRPAAWGQGIAFQLFGGMMCARAFSYGSLGWNCSLCCDWNLGLGILYLTNREDRVYYTNAGVRYFQKELLETVAAAFVYPHDTKLVRFCADYVWDAMRLTISEEQLEFMNSAQRAICIAYAYEQELFLLMEGNRTVGLIAFSVNQEKKQYYVESVLIDQKFQKRGFGTIMLRKGLEYLESLGCRYLTIGVNRFNVAAQKLYSAVGFTEKTVYEDFIEMEKDMCL